MSPRQRRRAAPTGPCSLFQNVVPGRGPHHGPRVTAASVRLGAHARGLINTRWPPLPACLLGRPRSCSQSAGAARPPVDTAGAVVGHGGGSRTLTTSSHLTGCSPGAQGSPGRVALELRHGDPHARFPGRPRRGGRSGPCPGFLTSSVSLPRSGKSERTSLSLGASGRSTRTA